MIKFEFVFAVMFMRLIIRKTKILTVQMQSPELNILDGFALIDNTVTSLERIRRTESELNDQIDASVKFAETLGSNPLDEFAKNSGRRISRQLDENPDSQGGRGNFTYLLEGQINFALKLSVGCLISQF